MNESESNSGLTKYGYGDPSKARLIICLKEPKENPETGTPMVLYADGYRYFRRRSDEEYIGPWWVQFYLSPDNSKIDVPAENIAFIKER